MQALDLVSFISSCSLLSHPECQFHKQSERCLKSESFHPLLDKMRKLARPICHSYNFSLKPLVMSGNNPQMEVIKF